MLFNSKRQLTLIPGRNVLCFGVKPIETVLFSKMLFVEQHFFQITYDYFPMIECQLLVIDMFGWIAQPSLA